MTGLDTNLHTKVNENPRGANELVVLMPGLVDYLNAWDLQRELHAERVENKRADTVLLLEHPAVYTAGKRTESWERPSDPQDTTPVIDVDRGGKITWHGPGQLVGYPILKLADPIDVVAYVRRMEQMLIAVCAELGVTAGQMAGRSGVWLPADDHRQDRKIAAIGIRIARGVTQHGFALNCDPEMSAYNRIVPCGITDASVTSLSLELGRSVGVAEVLPIVQSHLGLLLTPPATSLRRPHSAA